MVPSPRYELRARYGDSPRDLSLAVLQSVASKGPLPPAEIAEHLHKPRREIGKRLKGFEDAGFIELDVDEGDDGPFQIVYVLEKGLDLLEHWDFEEAVAEEEDGDGGSP